MKDSLGMLQSVRIFAAYKVISNRAVFLTLQKTEASRNTVNTTDKRYNCNLTLQTNTIIQKACRDITKNKG